jgi:beta-glucosidase
LSDAEKMQQALPENFLWGCATSPLQVEGDTVNEWRGFSAADGSTPDDGPNHWRRYRYDLHAAAELNLGAFRLGFDWGRLQPGPKEPFDRETSLRYLEMLAELRSLRIEPFLTLFHFCCPEWLAELGGWKHKAAPELFADFAQKMATMLDGEARNWITISNPSAYAMLGYGTGVYPPCEKGGAGAAKKVLTNLRRGHTLAYNAVKEIQPEAAVGLSAHFYQPRPGRETAEVAGVEEDSLGSFLGLDSFAPFLSFRNKPTADFVMLDIHLAGEAAPDGFWRQDCAYAENVLRETAKTAAVPLYVTGNGMEATDPEKHSQHLREHLQLCRNALADGVDLRGFFYGSLLDGFEFTEGTGKRYGLLAVNFEDAMRRRNIRPSGRFYGELARKNGACE